MRLPEEKKVVPVMALDTIGNGGDADSINMSKYHRAAFVITFGTLVGDAVLTVYSGESAGDKSSARTFSYALGGAAIGSEGCDVIGEADTSDALTLTAATYTDKMLIVEVDGAKMPLLHNWLTLSLSDAGTSGSCDVLAILEPRFMGYRSESALS